MKVYKPLGNRLLVEPLITTLSLEKRAELAGLHIVVEERERPKPTTGKVIALGPDPLLHELIKVGDMVFFGPYAGSGVTLEGKEYRQLEMNEVTGVEQEVAAE